MKAGVKSIGTVFLLTDAQVPEEEFLVVINDLLASGEVPDLFPDDEVEGIINGLRNEVKGAGLQDTNENCWKFFLDRVRRQLKVLDMCIPIIKKQRYFSCILIFTYTVLLHAHIMWLKSHLRKVHMLYHTKCGCYTTQAYVRTYNGGPHSIDSSLLIPCTVFIIPLSRNVTLCYISHCVCRLYFASLLWVPHFVLEVENSLL